MWVTKLIIFYLVLELFLWSTCSLFRNKRFMLDKNSSSKTLFKNFKYENAYIGFFPFFISYTNSIFSKIWQIWSILFGAFHQAKKPVISEEWYEYLYYNYLKRSQHGRSKYFCIILTGKIESVDLFIIPPLMKCRCGLVIFETLQNGTIDHDL